VKLTLDVAFIISSLFTFNFSYIRLSFHSKSLNLFTCDFGKWWHLAIKETFTVCGKDHGPHNRACQLRTSVRIRWVCAYVGFLTFMPYCFEVDVLSHHRYQYFWLWRPRFLTHTVWRVKPIVCLPNEVQNGKKRNEKKNLKSI